MTIKKLGHCCLRIEENGLTILTDPGSWTTTQNEEKGIDVILITQEHADHLDIGSLRIIMTNNPEVVILTNRGVGAILDKEQISYELLEHGQQKEIKGVIIKGDGEKHADIYPGVPVIVNTGYLIADKLFYPGDALTVPPESVEILALPVCGPWLTITDTLDYAKAIKPKTCFPVHDGMLKIYGPYHALPERILNPVGIKFVSLKDGEVLSDL